MRDKLKDEIEILILDLLNDGYVGDKVKKIIYKIIGERSGFYQEVSWLVGNNVPKVTHEDRIKKLEELTNANEYITETKLVKVKKAKKEQQ